MPATVMLQDQWSGRSSPRGESSSCDAYDFVTNLTAGAAYAKMPVWIDVILPVSLSKSTSQATEMSLATWEDEYMPRTSLGKSLVALRKKAIAAGMTLLNEEQVREEVRRRHGGVEAGEADVH
jgi:hypothetical protein